MRDEMNHGAVTPVPRGIEMRSNSERLSEVIQAPLGLTTETIKNAEGGHERGTVRIEGESFLKVVIRKLVITAEHVRAAEHGVTEIVAVVEGHGLFRQFERSVKRCSQESPRSRDHSNMWYEPNDA